MQVLIVEHNPRPGRRSGPGSSTRQGVELHARRHGGRAARAALRRQPFDALVLDMELPAGDALAVADFATYRNPDMPIIAVTARGFFSDTAIFELVPNARGLLRAPLRLEDMAALIEHYGGRTPPRGQRDGSGG